MGIRAVLIGAIIAFLAGLSWAEAVSPKPMDPSGKISPALLEEALVSLETHGSKVENKDVMAIADLSVRSGEPRFFILDLKSGEVSAFVTTHGKGSDPNPATGAAVQVSDARGSRASSRGAYVTAERYYSQKHNSDARRLDGLDLSNSRARCRCVVMHAATKKDGQNYASKAWIKKNGVAGRSDGCLAFAGSDLPTIMKRLPPGTFLYVGPSTLPNSPHIDDGKCDCPTLDDLKS